METAEHDVRCSNACTRAGIALLLLAAVSVGMIQQLAKTRQLNGLLKYTSARLIMNEELERLKHDVAWTALMASGLAAQAQTSWTLNKLIAYTDKRSLTLQDSQSSTLEQKGATPGPNSPPAAPTNLTVTTTVRIEPF